MAILYGEENQDSWFYQPAFSKSRHRYRGRKESYKLNLEISQFNYDVRNINKKINDLIIDTLLLSTSLSRGDDSVDYKLYRDINVITSVDGLVSTQSRVEDLRNRLIEMERKNV